MEWVTQAIRRNRIRSHSEMVATIMPRTQGMTAPYSSTLSSRPRMLDIRQSIFACLPCPNSDSRNGRKMIRTVPMVRADIAEVSWIGPGSEAAEVDRSRTRALAAFDDSLAAIGGRAAVIAMVTGEIVPVAGLRRGRESGGIADDRGWLA